MDLSRAQSLLERAGRALPDEPAIPLNLSFVHRATGDGAGEMAALTTALAIDPYFYPALLAKGLLVERSGNKRAAARIFRDVLAIAPPADQLPPELREKLVQTRKAVDENAAALAAELAKRTADLRARHAGESLERYEECEAVQLGRKKIYTQAPSLLHFPRLPAIQFYPRELFPWLPQLEAAADTIRDELLVVLREDTAEMRPYVSYSEGAPVAQWAELNHSPRWSAFFLWEHGIRNDAHCARCPKTAALLDAVPMMDCPGYAPTVLFSILSPHTHIPPHSSVTNARLVTHLPLIAPQGCRFRVGNETRAWKSGEAWVFDDTIEHEAWNDDRHLESVPHCRRTRPRQRSPEDRAGLVRLCTTTLPLREGRKSRARERERFSGRGNREYPSPKLLHRIRPSLEGRVKSHRHGVEGDGGAGLP
jgi:hypothetical protein